jgi:Icc-related predicted phosphoesterase
MKIIAVADLHGLLPNIPECDLLLIAGDIAPDLPMPSRHGSGYAAGVKAGQHRQLDWLADDFKRWLEEIPAKEVVGIAGNHDFAFELPHAYRDLDGLRWTYLRDEAHLTDAGLYVYGTPWVPALPNWAFYASENMLRHRAAAVPENLHILMTHGPPYGYRDKIITGTSVGDVPMAARLRELSASGEAPKAVICGHIHEGFGVEHFEDIPIINVAYVDENYEPVNGVTEIVEFSYG